MKPPPRFVCLNFELISNKISAPHLNRPYHANIDPPTEFPEPKCQQWRPKTIEPNLRSFQKHPFFVGPDQNMAATVLSFFRFFRCFRFFQQARWCFFSFFLRFVFCFLFFVFFLSRWGLVTFLVCWLVGYEIFGSGELMLFFEVFVIP